MNKCDLCGGVGIDCLRDSYKTRKISILCDECRAMVNDYLWKQRELFWKLEAKYLKRFLRRIKKAGKL